MASSHEKSADDRLDQALETALGDRLQDGDAAAEVALLGGEDELGVDDLDADALMDRIYAEGRRLERLGESVLMVSVDGLRAFFKGDLPAGTTYDEVMAVLERAGIGYGVKPAGIHQILPRKRARRSRRAPRRALAAVAEEVAVAEGLAPKAVGATRIEYLFRQADPSAIEEVVQRLEDTDFARVKDCPAVLSLVRPGQVLSRVVCDEGECGRDVFGEEIAPALPPGVELLPGEHVELAGDGLSCVACLCGYAVLREGVVAVLPPLWIARDLLRAFFVWLPQPQPIAPTPEEIEAVLAQEGIVHGIDEQAIVELCQRMQNGVAPARATLIARGTDAQPGRAAEWVYPFDPVLTKYYGEIRRILRKSPRVEYLAEYGQDLAGKAVAAGEVVATRRSAEQGAVGVDVFGEEFLPEEVEEAPLEFGDYLRLSPEGETCCAEIYGYIGIGQRRIELVSPVWVAPDRLAAYFVHFPALGERPVPSCEEVGHLLELAEVCYGIDEPAIAILCEKQRQGLPVEFATPIARGAKPQPGRDGHFEFYVDVEFKPGLFRADGTVDFKQLNMAPLVDKGQPLGALHPSVPGVVGRDVGGRQIAADPVCELMLDVGEQVAVVQQEDRPDRYVAEIEGELVMVDHRDRTPPALGLAVHEKLVVRGDVDYATGNIDFPGSVEVRGTVRAGFAVRAEGNVTVAGQIEDKAVVECGGNVAVEQGISGAGARVQAKGLVVAKYINAARIEAGGDLQVAEYIYNASVRTDGCVNVIGRSGGEQSGAIVGGKVIAGRRVRAQRIGSEAGDPTQVVAGFDSELLRQVAKLQQQIDQYGAALNKMQSALEVEKFDAQQIKNMLLNLLLKAKGPRRKVIARAASNLIELHKRREQALIRKGALDGQLQDRAWAAAIEVAGSVAVKTTLHIGGHGLTVGAEQAVVAQVKFCLGKVDGKTQLRMVAN